MPYERMGRGVLLQGALLILLCFEASYADDESVGGGETEMRESQKRGVSEEVKEILLTAVRLQAGNLTTLTSYIDAGFKDFPTMTEMTMCLHFRFHQYSNNSTLLSYYSEGIDNELLITVDGVKGVLGIECCSYHVRNHLSITPLSLFTWHHLCISVSLKQRHILGVIDGQVLNRTVLVATEASVEELVIRGGGHLVIGQDLDSAEGGFGFGQELNGDVADWRLLNTSLGLDMMKDYVACRSISKFPQPILHFDEAMSEMKVKGPSHSYTLRQEDVCRTTIADSLVIFPMKMEFKEAASLCRLLKGVLFVPTNKTENVLFYTKTMTHYKHCTDNSDTDIWLGIWRNVTTGKWHNEADESLITWNNFHISFISPGQDCNCASTGHIKFPEFWFCTPCQVSNFPTCRYVDNPIFRLRGRCTTAFDYFFTIKEVIGKRPKFLGYYKSQIVWDGKSWRLETTMNDTRSWGVLLDKVKHLPVGRGTWSLHTKHCGQLKVQLVITGCREDQYTCDDGRCVPRALRCNHRPDCDDSSDEHNCNVIALPEGYSRQLPPLPTSGRHLHLQFTQTITSVSQFNLLGFTVGFDLNQKIKWHDVGVFFNNLKEGNFSNKAEIPDELWLPDFSVESGSRSPAEVTVHSSSLLVQRDTKPLPDNLARPSEDEVFDGASNTLMLVQQYTITFNCQFRLSKYPFDTQRCALVYRLLDTGQRFCYSAEGVRFKGDPVLPEYEVVGVESSTHYSDQDSYIRVEVKFRNQFGNYIGNAFLPSVLLVTICYLTFWFSLHDFQDRIMVSLTSLLVLTGLLTQTSQTIPKTAYLKLIDVWYVVLISVDFIIIVVLVVIEGLRRQVRSPPQVKKIKRLGLSGLIEGKTGQGEGSAAASLNKFSIKVFPVVCVVFYISFFLIALG